MDCPRTLETFNILIIIIRSSILSIKLSISNILGETLHVFSVVIHSLHAPGQSSAGREVENLQSLANIQQLAH